MGMLCCVCIMLSLSYYHNFSRFAIPFFAFFLELYTFCFLSKNLGDFCPFLFAFYAKDEKFCLIGFPQSGIASPASLLFAPAGIACGGSDPGLYLLRISTVWPAFPLRSLCSIYFFGLRSGFVRASSVVRLGLLLIRTVAGGWHNLPT